MAFPLLCIFQPELVAIQGCLRVKTSLGGESDKRVFQRFLPDAPILGIDCCQIV